MARKDDKELNLSLFHSSSGFEWMILWASIRACILHRV